MITPSTIGLYQVERRLGGGGMAEVFLARRHGAEGFTRKVAIKRILPHASSDPTFSSLFIGEARLSASLHHPNLVSIIDFDRDPDQGFFLVMELVEGRDLSGLLEAGRLPVPITLYIIAEALRGLGHAHTPPEGEFEARGLIHRDISPHNVLLSWEGDVKVSDFGLAKARTSSQASASLMLKGKPCYMSPEQANGQELDGRSDLFAVGVMLWEMLVGESLFGRALLQDTFSALFNAPIPAPFARRSDVSEEVSQIALKLLERDRDNRFATAEDARSALLACAEMPRDGRAALSALLRERFGGRAADRMRAPTLLAGATPALAAATPSPMAQGTPAVPVKSSPPNALTLTPASEPPSAPAAVSSPVAGPALAWRWWTLTVVALLVGAIAMLALLLLSRSWRDSPIAPPTTALPPPAHAKDPSAQGGTNEPRGEASVDASPSSSTRNEEPPSSPTSGSPSSVEAATKPKHQAPRSSGEAPPPAKKAAQPANPASGIVDLNLQ